MIFEGDIQEILLGITNHFRRFGGIVLLLKFVQRNLRRWPATRPILERLAERKEQHTRLPSTMLQKQHFVSQKFSVVEGILKRFVCLFAAFIKTLWFFGACFSNSHGCLTCVARLLSTSLKIFPILQWYD